MQILNKPQQEQNWQLWTSLFSSLPSKFMWEFSMSVDYEIWIYELHFCLGTTYLIFSFSGLLTQKIICLPKRNVYHQIFTLGKNLP